MRADPLVNTPGKNAEAVADQTLGFLVMLARGMTKAQRFLADGNRIKDNWEGVRFLGNDLRGHTLGLVGYGRVGSRVAVRARACGMNVLVYDPLVRPEPGSDLEHVETLYELLARPTSSPSMLARPRRTSTSSTPPPWHRCASVPSSSDTARETLVDEVALEGALAAGRLGGVALDVFQPTPDDGPHRLLSYDNVVLTPHIGGATYETLLNGAEMIAEEISRFASGESLINVINPQAVSV